MICQFTVTFTNTVLKWAKCSIFITHHNFTSCYCAGLSRLSAFRGQFMPCLPHGLITESGNPFMLLCSACPSILPGAGIEPAIRLCLRQPPESGIRDDQSRHPGLSSGRLSPLPAFLTSLQFNPLSFLSFDIILYSNGTRGPVVADYVTDKRLHIFRTVADIESTVVFLARQN